jgi:hypothetical protein
MKNRLATRFYDAGDDPRASLVNLVDVMLVFACGLLAAITAAGAGRPNAPVTEIERGRPIEHPDRGQFARGGYEAIGQVYRDPKTGKLILLESRTDH